MESQVRVSLDGEGHTLDVDKMAGPEWRGKCLRPGFPVHVICVLWLFTGRAFPVFVQGNRNFNTSPELKSYCLRAAQNIPIIERCTLAKNKFFIW
jgi:hypothetical protein